MTAKGGWLDLEVGEVTKCMNISVIRIFEGVISGYGNMLQRIFLWVQRTLFGSTNTTKTLLPVGKSVLIWQSTMDIETNVKINGTGVILIESES